MTRDLLRLLRPRSIAVVGGGFWGANVVEQCLAMGFAGPIWPVHPKREEIHGLPCFRTVEALPEAPDAAFIGVNRTLTPEIVARLAARGAGGAVCFASGFRETADGGALEAALVEAAGAMPILGPNCYGFINYLDGALLWPDAHGGRRVERGVAIVGQSSNMLISVTMQRRALPLAYVVAAGNQAQTGLAAIATALLEDPRVTALGLHVEGVGDAAAFETMAARARALEKPVVALRVGRSEAARAAAISHTASIAGGDTVGRAFFHRLGIPLVETLPEFLETLKLLHVTGPLGGREIASMSCSGGEAALIADSVARRALAFRPLDAATRARLAEVLGPRVAIANPLDYHTYIWGDAARMAAVYEAMLGAGADLTLLVLDLPRTDRCSEAAWQCAIEGAIAARRRTEAPFAVLASLPENLPEPHAERFLAEGIAPLQGFEEGLAAAEAAAAIGAARQRPPAPPVLRAPPAPGTARLLDEAAAKALLAGHGIAVPAGARAATPAEAAARAGALGFPVVLKGLGHAHKAEAGAVRLGLASAAAVAEAAEAMAAAGAAPGGFLVERMVEGGVAELLLGVARDPVYGFALTLGAGGTLTELLADAATLMLPAEAAEIRAALAGLRIAPLLDGHRGRPAGDVEAVVAAALALARFAAENAARLEEAEINPLIVTPTGAIAADALVRIREDRDDR